MAKKMSARRKWIYAIFIIEIALLIFSSGLNKTLKIGFNNGTFVFKNVAKPYNLQEHISEDFQVDKFVQDAAFISLENIKDIERFANKLLTSDNIIIAKMRTYLTSEAKEILAKKEFEEHKLAPFIVSLDKIQSDNKFAQPEFLSFIKNENAKDVTYLINKYNKSLKDTNIKLDVAENRRFNRILIESVFPEEMLEHQDVIPEIYGSYQIYDAFKKVFGVSAAINAFRLIRILIIVDIVILLLIFATRKLIFSRPSKPQLIFEMLYELFEGFVKDTLGEKNLHFTPYIVTLFFFIWVCNMIGMVPIPGFIEPTRNLNVTLGLGLFAIVVVHVTAIKAKGLWHHFQNYINPVKNPLFVLDIVGEVSKVVSISFRLFGNILGGAIIILVVSSLVKFVMLPVGLNLFFGVFVGTIQAFVFTMLALTYIGVELGE